MSGIRSIWILAVALLLPATEAAFAHGENELIRIHDQCRGSATFQSSPKNRNTVFQSCLRKSFSAQSCRHPDRSHAFKAHNAQHSIRVDRLCREAAKMVCHRTRSPARCQPLVMHDCLKTEDLCKQGARSYSDPTPAFPSVR